MVNEFAELQRLKYLRGEVGLSALLGDKPEVKTFGMVLVPNIPRIGVVLVPDYPKDKNVACTRLHRDLRDGEVLVPNYSRLHVQFG